MTEIKFKSAAELTQFLDPRNKIFIDWTKNTIHIELVREPKNG